MIADCANCGRYYNFLHLRLTTMGALIRCQNGTGDDFLRSKVDTGRIPRFGRLTASHACLVSSTVIFYEILEVLSVLYKDCRWWYSLLNSVILYSKHSTSLTMVSWRRDQSLRRRSIRPILTLHTVSTFLHSEWSFYHFITLVDHSNICTVPWPYPQSNPISDSIPHQLSVVLVSYVKDGLRPFFRPTEV